LRFSGVQFSNSAFRSVNLPSDIEVTVVHWEFYVSFCDVSLYVHSSRLCLQIWMEVGVTHWCVLRSKRNPFVWEICVCLWFYKVRVRVTCFPSWIGICLVLFWAWLDHEVVLGVNIGSEFVVWSFGAFASRNVLGISSNMKNW
jgi:hypothetical protein